MEPIPSFQVTFTLANTSMESLKVKVSTDGLMGRSTLAISTRVSSMVRAAGEAQRMECLSIITMGTTNMIKRVAMESKHGQVETSTKVTTSMMRDMVMDRCSGPTAACMRVSGSEVSSTELEGWCSLMDLPKKDILRTMSSSTH